jgi:hypothetical protein
MTVDASYCVKEKVPDPTHVKALTHGDQHLFSINTQLREYSQPSPPPPPP